MNTTITDQLKVRCENVCELCIAENASVAYAVSPTNEASVN